MDPAILSVGIPVEAVALSNTTTTTLKDLLAPYSKEELVELIARVAAADGQFEQNWFQILQHDTKWCKLFVHGLSYHTTNASLHEFYSKFGPLKEAVVLMDKKGQSKGFGFVTFAHRDAAMAATKLERHKIDNRTTHCCLAFVGNPRKLEGGGSSAPSSPKASIQMPETTQMSDHQPQLAAPSAVSPVGSVASQPSVPMSSSPSPVARSPHPPNDDPSRSARRLFVHSLAWKTEDETLRNTFAEFGEIEEAIVIRDKKSQKSKGYGFVVFTDAESAEKALAEPEKTIDGRITKCNLACERPVTHTQQSAQPYQQNTFGGPGAQAQPNMTQQPMQPQSQIHGQNFAFVPTGMNGMMIPQVSLSSVPSLNGYVTAPVFLNGMQASGSVSVSSAGQPFNPFAQPPSSVSSGTRGVFVPLNNVFAPMSVNSFPSIPMASGPKNPPQMNGHNQSGAGSQPRKTKIIAVPVGNRPQNGNGPGLLRQSGPTPLHPDGLVHSRGRVLPSVGSFDKDSDRSSPITQGSPTPEPF